MVLFREFWMEDRATAGLVFVPVAASNEGRLFSCALPRCRGGHSDFPEDVREPGPAACPVTLTGIRLRARLACLAPVLMLASPFCAASAAPMTDPLKIVTIGTSLTAMGGWQAPLQKDLTECLGIPVAVTNQAGSGETSHWGVQNIDAILAERPDIALIEFAANDAALNRFVSLSQSVENVREIVRAVRAQNRRAVIVIQAMNPFWGFRRWVRPFLDQYIEAHAALAQELGVDFIDHRQLWAAYSDAEMKRMIPDGAHPLPGYSARMIATHIKTWLVERHFSGRCLH